MSTSPHFNDGAKERAAQFFASAVETEGLRLANGSDGEAIADRAIDQAVAFERAWDKASREYASLCPECLDQPEISHCPVCGEPGGDGCNQAKVKLEIRQATDATGPFTGPLAAPHQYSADQHGGESSHEDGAKAPTPKPETTESESTDQFTGWPCPFCGHIKLFHDSSYSVPDGGEPDRRAMTLCRGCGAHGPTVDFVGVEGEEAASAAAYRRWCVAQDRVDHRLDRLDEQRAAAVARADAIGVERDALLKEVGLLKDKLKSTTATAIHELLGGAFESLGFAKDLTATDLVNEVLRLRNAARANATDTGSIDGVTRIKVAKDVELGDTVRSKFTGARGWVQQIKTSSSATHTVGVLFPASRETEWFAPCDLEIAAPMERSEVTKALPEFNARIGCTDPVGECGFIPTGSSWTCREGTACGRRIEFGRDRELYDFIEQHHAAMTDAESIASETGGGS